MLPEIRLFITAPEPESLAALRNLRRLVDGPWKGQCDWSVSEGPDMATPALGRFEGGRTAWFTGDPAAAIPEEWLFAPGPPGPTPSPPPAGPATPAAGATWRELIDAAPVPAALFLEGCLVYANQAFARQSRLELPSALGRRPREWADPAASEGLEAALRDGAPAAGESVGPTVRALSGPASVPLQAVYLPPAGDAAVRPLLDQVRTINHAIGNALVGIVGYGELLEQAIPAENTSAHSRLKMIASAAQRVDELSREISAAIRAYLGLSGSSQ